jgi:hypothetical protein
MPFSIHTVRRQYVEVEFNGTEADGLNLQRILPGMCQSKLMPVIEKALDRYTPANTYLTIDRLEIDAGSVMLDRLEHDLPEMVYMALGQYLQDIPRPEDLSNVFERGNLQRKTEQQTIIAAFIFFLKHGTLPWSFHLPSGSGFEEMILGSFKEQEGRGGAFELNEVIETLASATARKRLIQQFTPAFLEIALALIATEGKKVFRAVLPLLRRSDTVLIDAKQLEREVWECAFACIASCHPLTEEYLRRETNALVTALGVRGASLAAALDYYWSEVPKVPNNEDFQVSSSSPAGSSQQSDGGAADEEQKVVHHERTILGSESSEEEEQLHPERGNPDQEKLQREPASLSRHSEGTDEAQKGIHDERTLMHGSASPDGNEQLHQDTVNSDQERLLNAQTDLLRRTGDSADEEQKGVPDEKITHGSASSDGNEQLHQESGNSDQAQLLKAPTDLLRRTDGSDESEKETRHQTAKAKESVSQSAAQHPDAKTGIYTALAGLVLLHPFLPQFFRALDIADDEKLLQPDRAIYLLYFLATGRTDAMEYELAIPKMLCHFPLTNVVESNISLLADEQEEALALLAAVIRHWEVMKNTGADGLRETFLKRCGKLSQRDDGEWLLQVETNSFDILLEQLPWGISMIQLPWMPGMLRVEWI